MGHYPRDTKTAMNKDKVSTQISVTGGGPRQRRKCRLSQMDRLKQVSPNSVAESGCCTRSGRLRAGPSITGAASPR
ncbi:hypothetical protein BHE74_00054025 [Ensete ventricosum]|nr:hypothetical protein BHE74_00054025 [Ensete ventricosum]